MDFLQEDRPIGFEAGSLGPDALALTAFHGEERMSDLFEFKLTLIAPEDRTVVEPQQIVGEKVGFWVRHSESDKERWFSGYVSRFAYTGTGDRGHTYEADVVPWLWFLTRNHACMVHSAELVNRGDEPRQDTAKDVIERVFGEYGEADFKWDLSRDLEHREFCVQYEETDFNFVSRLLEHEGIFYYFEHSQSGHKLVLSDTTDGFPTAAPDDQVSLASNLSQPELTDKLTAWHHEYQFITGKWVHTDFDFTKPSTSLEKSTRTVVPLSDTKKHEWYEDAGGYHDPGVGDALVKARMQGEESTWNTVSGASVCRAFSPGHTFELVEHHTASEQDKWLLTAVRHDANLGGSYVPGASHSGEIYSNQFRCIPAAVQFRPPRKTPTPRINGIQTAMVVGSGEIFTDEYGRVQVHFNWDRDNKNTCWVRVAHPWTGKNWGMVSIPRVGQEVVVDFINGHPDRPLITGMVYNEETMPPYELPANKTQTGIKTRSSEGGAADNFNEVRFEDLKDAEEIYVHAERDFNCIIENNETRKIGHEKSEAGDQEIDVYNNQTITVGVGSGSGNQVIEVLGNRTVTVQEGNETIEISQGDQSVTVAQGSQAISLGQGDRDISLDQGSLTTTVSLGSITYEAMQSIELKVGSNSIKIDQTGVTITGMMLNLEGTTMAELKAPMTTVKGDGMLTIKGGVTMIN